LPHAWGKLNTDFPNYYMSARLVHEGFDTTRINEWAWLQREKDHRAVDVATIGILPITPFSTLVMWPLAAKHVWIVFNLGLLIPLFWMLRNLTGLSWQRIGLVFALSFPLHRNFLFGQFYLLLLVLIVAAVWAYLRGWHGLAGGLIAVAAACKIFPILLFVFFVQRRAWRALIAGAATLLAAGDSVRGIRAWRRLKFREEVSIPLAGTPRTRFDTSYPRFFSYAGCSGGDIHG
jgi:Glycosyltransferase family 87